MEARESRLEQNKHVRNLFFPRPSWLSLRKEDCCLCVSAVEPLGIIREYCWAGSWAKVSSGSLRLSQLHCCRLLSHHQSLHKDGIGYQLQHCHLPVVPTLPSFWQRAVHASTPQTPLFTLTAPPGLELTSIICPSYLFFHHSICIHFPPTANTYPSDSTTSTPLHLLLEGLLPQSMGPPPLSPPPCPLPCLCSEAVCCGSTNGRVRRNLCTSLGPHACHVGWKDREEALFACLLGCSVRVEQHVL